MKTYVDPRGMNKASQPNSNMSLEDGMKVNGLQQVIDMLKYADPTFRQSLIRRIEVRDPRLAKQLRVLFR